MWENMVERGRAQMAVWRMRVACWIPKATGTHSEYVALIAFPLHERASVLRLFCVLLWILALSYCLGFFTAATWPWGEAILGKTFQHQRDFFFFADSAVSVLRKIITGTSHEDRYDFFFNNISLSSAQNEKCSRQKLYRKSKHTFCVPQLFP